MKTPSFAYCHRQMHLYRRMALCAIARVLERSPRSVHEGVSPLRVSFREFLLLRKASLASVKVFRRHGANGTRRPQSPIGSLLFLYKVIFIINAPTFISRFLDRNRVVKRFRWTELRSLCRIAPSPVADRRCLCLQPGNSSASPRGVVLPLRSRVDFGFVDELNIPYDTKNVTINPAYAKELKAASEQCLSPSLDVGGTVLGDASAEDLAKILEEREIII